MFKLKANFLLLFTCLFVFQATAQVTADFSADNTNGCGSASVNFTDLSSGNITSRTWTFGNGNTSTVQNPSVNYTIVGTYDVTLIISDGTNFDTITKTNFIQVFRGPTADFTVNPSTGCSPLPVDFTDNSTAGSAAIQEYKWDFSDGSQASSAQNPTHIYQTGGTYPPSLQVTDTNGCSDIEVFNDIIVTAAPVANFSSPKSTTCADTLTVSFNNSSTGGSLSYEWFFGDGQTSTQANPTHFYNGLGTYDVTLIVSDPNCSDTLVEENFVRLESTTALFSTPKDSLCFGEPINFNNLSTGANLFRWEFGDGTTSSEKNPTKVYQDSGFFKVKLTVSAGPICVKSFIDTIYVQQVIADFTSFPNFICDDFDTVVYTNNSINSDSTIWKITKLFNRGSTEFDTTFPPKNFTYYQNNRFYFQGGGYIRVDGVYSDTLISMSKLGCVDTIVKDSNRVVKLLRTEISFLENPNIIPWEKAPGYIIDGGCAPVDFNFFDSTIGSLPVVKWKWDFGFDTSTLQNPPIQTFVDDTFRNVSLIVTNIYGCRDTAFNPVQVGFKQNPSYILLSDTVCPDETLQILNTSQDSTKISDVTFRFFSVYTDERMTNKFIDYPDTGYYQILQTIQHNGCDTINQNDTGLFYVNGPIADPDFSAGDCQNRRLINFEGDFRQVTRFHWDFGDGSPIDSVNLNPSHLYSNFKRYKAILKIFNDTNGCNPRELDTILVDIRPLPFLRILPPRRTLCTSDSLSLHSNASMRYEKFNWIINGDTVSRKNRIPFDTVPGRYIIELYTIDELGCTFSALDTFFVARLEAGFDTTILDNCFPSKVAFTDTSFTDTTIISWEWRFGNGDTSFLQNDTITYSTAGRKSVFLKIENEFGCKDSIVKKNLLNFELLNVRFLNDLTEVCIGDSIRFRNVSGGLNPIYTWDFGDGTILSDTSAEFIEHSYTQAGTYTVSLSAVDESGCVKSDTKTNLITVDQSPLVGFTADTLEAECYPFAVNFQDTTSGNISTWEWRFGDGASSVFQNPFHNYTAVGEFDVFLKVSTPAGCADSIEKAAYIKTKGPTAEFVFDKDTICLNEEVTFNITQSNNVASFFWDFGDGNGGQGNPITHTYTQKTGKIIVALILSDSSGNCTVPLEDSLFVYNVKADFTVSDDTACVPFEADFTNTSVGDDSFRWVLAPGVFSTDPNPSFNFQQAGSFPVSLEISSAIGCRDTATKIIEIFPIPLAEVSSDTGFCEGDSVLLIGSGGTSYRWTPTNGLSDPFNIITHAFPDSTTNYQLLVSNAGGCEDSSSVEVFVQHPIDYSAIPDTSIIIGETVNLNAFTGLGFSYKWTPEIGLSCNDCANPIAKPLKNQRYILEIFDAFDCYYLKDTINIEVIEKYSLDVPTAFSPNGDGSNDIIYAKGWGLKELIAFKIYNRFGELVFESTDFDKGWDGTYRGQPQNIETYVFTVEALTYSGRVLTKKGNISLLR